MKFHMKQGLVVQNRSSLSRTCTKGDERKDSIVLINMEMTYAGTDETKAIGQFFVLTEDKIVNS